jgi:hypothetical protein
MVEHGDAFCAALGVNMHTGAHAMITRLQDFSPLFMEGDYSGYDIGTPVDISRASGAVIYRVCQHFGYTEEALTYVTGVLSDNTFPILEMNNDIFIRPGLQTSGKYATAEDNSLKGVIYLMYAWYENESLRELDFFQYCLPLVYGDDVVVAVKEPVSHLFNNVIYSDMCKRLYNVKFTSAAKNDTLREFVTIDEVSFLKRNFVFWEDEQRYVAPLDTNSIHKGVMWFASSTHVSEEDQRVSALTSELSEIFFHTDEKQYNNIRDTFIDVMIDTFHGDVLCYESAFPTYLTIYNRIFGTRETGGLDPGG